MESGNGDWQLHLLSVFPFASPVDWTSLGETLLYMLACHPSAVLNLSSPMTRGTRYEFMSFEMLVLKPSFECLNSMLYSWSTQDFIVTLPGYLSVQVHLLNTMTFPWEVHFNSGLFAKVVASSNKA